LIYQFWIHTEAISKLPRWVEAAMNTPSHHRVHHGRNARYLDANYAGVFIIWDKLFGTFVPELDRKKTRLGARPQYRHLQPNPCGLSRMGGDLQRRTQAGPRPLAPARVRVRTSGLQP